MEAPLQSLDPPLPLNPGGAEKAQHVPVWRNRPFMWLLSGNTASVFGDSFHGIAISLWVLQTTGSAQRMAAVQICTMAVSFLFGSFAGTVADRVDRRRLMLLSDVSRCLIAALLGICLFVFGVPFPAMLALVSLSTFLGLLQSPAFHASTTTLAGQGRIQQASSAMHLADNLARISGLALAGVAVASFGGLAAILTTSAAFLLSAVCTLLAGRFPSARRDSSEQVSFLQDWSGGLAYIRKDPLIRSVVILNPVLTAFFLTAIMLVQVMAVKSWNANPIEFGLIEMCIPLGYMAGAGIIIAFGQRFGRRGRLVFIGLILLGPMYFLISGLSSPHAALPFVLLGGLLFSFCSMMVQIILKTEVRSEWQGRIYGTMGAITSMAPPLCLAIASMLADRWGASTVLAAQSAGLLALGIAAAILLKPIRVYR